MKPAFTLIELLVVIGIMGLLGTASVGGYRQMRRGMEEKGVLQDVNFLVRAAYQRAQVDRQPTAVVFWNETLRGENDSVDGNVIVVGHAVAVRRAGRISYKNGNDLVDEFADLELSNQTGDDESGSSKATMYLYPMHRLQEMESGSSILRSTVETKVYPVTTSPVYLSTENGMLTESVASSKTSGREGLCNGESSGSITSYAYRIVDAGGVSWRPGMAYGFEFSHVVLPHGYIFGSNYSTSSSDPVQEAGTLVFDVGLNTGNGMTQGSQGGLGSRKSVVVSALKLGSSGTFVVKKIGDSDDPTNRL